MLPEQDWLSAAKRLAVGMRVRIRHRNETRANLVIANEADKWWAYCQRCHEGGVVEKEHVRLLDAQVSNPPSLTFPTDAVQVLGSEFEVQVERFLASKNMASEYLPPLWVSPKDKRLLVYDGEAWHGRDLTGRSPAKWLNYSDLQVSGEPGRITVVVEDLFSRFKTEWALRDEPDVHVLCALGTQAKPALIHKLMLIEKVIWFFDADAAGDAGAQSCTRRLRAFAPRQCRLRPPQGLDPKDMDCATIKEEVLQCCY